MNGFKLQQESNIAYRQINGNNNKSNDIAQQQHQSVTTRMRNKEGLQTQAADDHHQRHLYECLPQERVQPSSCTQQYAGSGQLYTGSTQQYTGSTSQHPGSTMHYTGSSPQHTGSTPQYTGSTQQYTGLLRRREEEKHEEDLNEIRSDKYYYMRRFSIFFLLFISSLFSSIICISHLHDISYAISILSFLMICN